MKEAMEFAITALAMPGMITPTETEILGRERAMQNPVE
jgi:hypothetical protein